MHHCVLVMFCPVRVDGAAAGEADGSGGSVWQWEDFLCQPPEEAVRAAGGADPAGWRTAAPLPTQILPSKGRVGEDYL